jgi:flagellar biosynthesis chaperone FliJ
MTAGEIAVQVKKLLDQLQESYVEIATNNKVLINIQIGNYNYFIQRLELLISLLQRTNRNLKKT